MTLVPLAELLSPDEDDESERADADDDDHASAESKQDALDTLRERYARGDLTEEQFERKLDRLLETETPEDVADARARARTTEPERE